MADPDEQTPSPASEPRERELKLVATAGAAKALKARMAALAGDGRRRVAARLSSTYFDTEALDLKRVGVSLRLRGQGRTRVQTLKAGGGAGFFDRLERERRTTGDAPELTEDERAELVEILGGPLPADRPLAAMFGTEVKRTRYDVRRGETAVEIALDDVSIEAGDRKLSFWEIEIELRAGETAGLFRIARELADAAPLRLGVLSKSARGHALRAGDERRAAKAEASPVRPGMDVEAAFLAIAADCVSQFRINEDLLLERPEPKAVHQARVALRRLRSAFALFREPIADGRSDTLAAELKWLAGSLGDARDLDVLIKDRLGPAAEAEDEAEGMAELTARAAGRRDAAYAEALEALRARRALDLMIDLAEWTAVGDWRGDPRLADLRTRPVESFAADMLDKRMKRLTKKAKRLAEGTPEERHRARIQAKKLRYAAEFFEPLYPGGKPAKRFDRFSALLKRLQNELGALNDIATARGLTLGLARPEGAREDLGDAAFAAGFVCGGAEAHAPALVAAAAKRFRKLEKAKPFWR